MRWSAALVTGALAACYDVPKPECGFVCGPSNSCPTDYACNTADNRCHLVGTIGYCPSGFDAGMDGDPMAPFVLGVSPFEGETDVFVEQNPAVTFSERVIGASPVTIILAVGGVQVPGTVAFDLKTNTAVYSPAVDLARRTTYTMTVTDDSIDLTGNPLSGATTWQFSTATPPMLEGLSPSSGATNVSVAHPVFADFDEPVFGVTISSFLVSASGVQVPGTANTNMFADRASFTPNTQLAANTDYLVRLTTVVTDGRNNPLDNEIAWTFRTGADTVPPQVVQRLPVENSTNIDVNRTVTVRFNEGVLGVTTASFTLTPQGGAPVATTLTHVAGTPMATLRHDLQLIANTTYTVAMSTAVTDVAGNPLTAPLSWSFMTGSDFIAPRLLATSPLDLATSVPTSSVITVRFDEPVQDVTAASFTVNGGAITGTITLSMGDTLVTFTPSSPLPAGAAISVNLTTAITDTVGNPLDFPIAFSFTTAP